MPCLKQTSLAVPGSQKLKCIVPLGMSIIIFSSGLRKLHLTKCMYPQNTGSPPTRIPHSTRAEFCAGYGNILHKAGRSKIHLICQIPIILRSVAALHGRLPISLVLVGCGKKFQLFFHICVKNSFTVRVLISGKSWLSACDGVRSISRAMYHNPIWANEPLKTSF